MQSDSLHHALIGLLGDPSHPDYRDAMVGARVYLDTPLSAKPTNDKNSILRAPIFGISDAHIPLNQGTWLKNDEGYYALDLSPERLHTIALKTFNRAHLLHPPYDEIVQKIHNTSYRVFIRPADPEHVDAHIATAMVHMPSLEHISRPKESGRFSMRRIEYDTLHEKWLDSCNRRLFNAQPSPVPLSPAAHFALRSIFENYHNTSTDALVRDPESDKWLRAGHLSVDTLHAINSNAHILFWPAKDLAHADHVAQLISQEFPSLTPPIIAAEVEGKAYLKMHSSIHDLLTKSWDAAELKAAKEGWRIPTGQVTDGTAVSLANHRDKQR